MEDLQRKVRETAMRVKQLRATAPSKIEEALCRDLDRSRDALTRSLAACEPPPAAAAAPLGPAPSPACAEAFLEDVADIAASVRRLRAALPEQVARTRRAVRVCQEWAGKPLSAAEQLVAEDAAAAAAAAKAVPRAPEARRLRTAAGLAMR